MVASGLIHKRLLPRSLCLVVVDVEGDDDIYLRIRYNTKIQKQKFGCGKVVLMCQNGGS